MNRIKRKRELLERWGPLKLIECRLERTLCILMASDLSKEKLPIHLIKEDVVETKRGYFSEKSLLPDAIKSLFESHTGDQKRDYLFQGRQGVV